MKNENWKLFIKYRDQEELEKKTLLLKKFENQELTESTLELLRKNSIYWVNQSLINQPIAFLYPGQSSAYQGMYSTLIYENPFFKKYFEIADRFAKNNGYKTLTDVITMPENEDLIGQIFYSQILPFTSQMATSVYLNKELRVQPKMLIGHSVGEFAALCFANSFSFEQGLEILLARARAVSSVKNDRPTKMIAVRADHNLTDKIINKYPQTFIANYNSSDQTVIATFEDNVKDLIAEFSKNSIDTKELVIPYAFHSPFLKSAVSDFHEYLNTISFNLPQIKCTSLISSRPIEAASDIPLALAQALISPVRFQNILDYSYTSGIRQYIDLGPSWTLKNLVERNLKSKNFKCFYFNHRKEKDFDTAERFKEEFFLYQNQNQNQNQSLKPTLQNNFTEVEMSPQVAPLISGSAHERGYQLGSIWKKNFTDYGWIVDRLPVEFRDAEKSTVDNLVNSLSLDHREELEGMIEATGAPGDVIKRIACLSSIVTTRYGLCFGRISEDAHIANYDFPFVTKEDSFRMPRAVIEYHTPNKYKFLGFFKLGNLFPMGGLNDKGLSITVSAGAPTGSVNKGLNVHLLTRELLENCKNIQEIENYIKNKTIEGAWIYLIYSTVDDKGIRIEWRDKQFQIISDSNGLLATNHFQNLDNIGTLRDDSVARLNRLKNLHSQESSRLSSAFKILKDKFDVERGRETKFSTKNTLNRYNTSFSVCMQPQRLSLYASYQEIPSGEGPYICYKFRTEHKSLRWVNKITKKIELENNLGFEIKDLLILISENLSKEERVDIERKFKCKVTSWNEDIDLNKFRYILDLSPLVSDGSWKNEEFSTIKRMSRLISRGLIDNQIIMLCGYGEIDVNGGYKTSLLTNGMNGFYKAIKIESSEIAYRFVLFHPNIGKFDIIQDAIQIFKTKSWTTESIKKGGSFFCLQNVISPLKNKREEEVILKNETVLITGGAGGITAEIGFRLLNKYPARLLVIGRSQIEGPIVNVSQSEFLKQIREKNPGKKPKEYMEFWSRFQREMQTKKNLIKYKEMGLDVHYLALDLNNLESVKKHISQWVHENGPIHHLVHGAGTQKSKLLKEKDYAEFDQILDSKTVATQNLLNVLKGHPLKNIILFSSVSGVNGNIGQTDYAAANASHIALSYCLKDDFPLANVKTISWPAWSGAGMAMDASVHSEMKAANIGFIDLKDGVDFFINEVEAKNSTHHVVCTSFQDNDSTILTDLYNGKRDSFECIDGLTELALVDTIIEVNDDFWVFEKVFSGNEEFLRDHQVKGVPIVPGVMLTEMLIESLNLIFKDKKTSVEIESINFKSPVRVDPDIGTALRLKVFKNGNFEFSIPKNRSDGMCLLFENVTTMGFVRKINFEEKSFELPTEQNIKIKTDAFYKKLLKLFPENLGPSFHTLEEVVVKSKSEVWAKAKCSNSINFPFGKYFYHPSIFDLMNHAVIEGPHFTEENLELTYLPYEFRKVRPMRSFVEGETYYIHLSDFNKSAESISFSVVFVDSFSRVCMTIAEVIHRQYKTKVRD